MDLSRHTCQSLDIVAINGLWHHAIKNTHLTPRHLEKTLYASDTRRGRFNPAVLTPISRPFQILYLSEEPQVAQLEARAAFLAHTVPAWITIPNYLDSWTVVPVDVQLHVLVDLTSPTNQLRLATSAQELTGDWAGYHLRGPSSVVQGPTGLAPTQELGAVIRTIPRLNGALPEGALYISAKWPVARNVVVFPRNFRPGSWLRYTDVANDRYEIGQGGQVRVL